MNKFFKYGFLLLLVFVIAGLANSCGAQLFAESDKASSMGYGAGMLVIIVAIIATLLVFILRRRV